MRLYVLAGRWSFLEKSFIFVNCIVLIFAFLLGTGLQYYENGHGILSVPEPRISDLKIPEMKSDAQQERININTATEEELCELYGIGEKFSARIIRYRENEGEFKQVQDIMKVNGIGKKLFEKIRDYICV